MKVVLIALASLMSFNTFSSSYHLDSERLTSCGGFIELKGSEGNRHLQVSTDNCKNLTIKTTRGRKIRSYKMNSQRRSRWGGNFTLSSQMKNALQRDGSLKVVLHSNSYKHQDSVLVLTRRGPVYNIPYNNNRYEDRYEDRYQDQYNHNNYPFDEIVTACNTVSVFGSERMKCQRIGASPRKIYACNSISSYGSDRLKCQRISSSPRIVKACVNVSMYGSDRLKCMRTGASPRVIRACNTVSNYANERIRCMRNARRY